MRRDAFIHESYRYTLSRDWSPEDAEVLYPSVCFIMLNPSTADGQQDDPTLRKCIGFTKMLGYSKLTVVNLFALRATDPKRLIVCKDFGADIHRAREQPLHLRRGDEIASRHLRLGRLRRSRLGTA